MAKIAAVVAVALALAGSLAGCTTPTPYQPIIPGQSSSGGYAEVRVEPNRWRVTFAGNSVTSRETVESYLLFRAAELTTQQGYDWFSMVDRQTENKGYSYLEPTYGPYGYWRPYWRYYGAGFGWHSWDPYWGSPFWGDSVDIRTIDKYEATAEIFMGKGPKPAADPRAFDAHQVIANLQARIIYPEQPKTPS